MEQNEALETNERNKKLGWFTVKDYVLVILLVLLIVVILIGVYEFRNYQSSCMVNPLVYGVAQLSQQNNEDVSCTCNKPSGGSIYVTKEGITDFIKNNPFSNFSTPFA